MEECTVGKGNVYKESFRGKRLKAAINNSEMRVWTVAVHLHILLCGNPLYCIPEPREMLSLQLR
jgi:hypothetical protein